MSPNFDPAEALAALRSLIEEDDMTAWEEQMLPALTKVYVDVQLGRLPGWPS